MFRVESAIPLIFPSYAPTFFKDLMYHEVFIQYRKIKTHQQNNTKNALAVRKKCTKLNNYY